jgi:hypothetical protein
MFVERVPVDTKVKSPFTVTVAMANERGVPVCEALFQVSLPNTCPVKPVGAIVVTPVIKHSDGVFQVAVGTTPVFWS